MKRRYCAMKRSPLFIYAASLVFSFAQVCGYARGLSIHMNGEFSAKKKINRSPTDECGIRMYKNILTSRRFVVDSRNHILAFI